MRAILIDAKARTITEIEHTGLYADIKRTLDGDEPGKVDLIQPVWVDDDNFFFLDEEGFLKPNEYFWHWGSASQPFAGNAIIFGRDDEADSGCGPATIHLSEVKAQVTFTSAADEGFDPKIAVMDQTRRFHPVVTALDGDAMKALFGG